MNARWKFQEKKDYIVDGHANSSSSSRKASVRNGNDLTVGKNTISFRPALYVK